MRLHNSETGPLQRGHAAPGRDARAAAALIVLAQSVLLVAGVTVALAVPSLPVTPDARAARVALAAIPVLAGGAMLMYRALDRAWRHAPTASGAAADARPAFGEQAPIAALPGLRPCLSAAEWRDARLAALAAAVIKAGHDLRGVLSPAMLTAERLQMSSDAAVKHNGDVMLRAIERAAEVMKRPVEMSREGHMVLPKTRLTLRPLVEACAEHARAAPALALAVENAVPDDIEIEANAAGMARALDILLATSVTYGARRARIAADVDDHTLVIMFTDDGAGLPAPLRAAALRPPDDIAAGEPAQLALAMVRDLMRANGGEAVLPAHSDDRTLLRLTLPVTRSLLPTSSLR